MQPDLPWNVAGIAPEARDAARASARREGLSVSEWLTRRIMQGLAETERTTDGCWLTEPVLPRGPTRTLRSPLQNGETPHWTHSESDSGSADHRIEDQLKSLARRLEQTERSQAEHRHALGEIVARDRAQTFEQLGARAAQFNERLTQIERNSAADRAGERESIRALHERVASLAEHVTRTAARSEEQAAQLAGTIESVAARFSRTRSETQEQYQALENRTATSAEDIGSLGARLFDLRDEAERLEVRLATMETTIARFESDRDATARLAESLDDLTRRFETDEATHFSRLARLEDRLDANDGEVAIDRRLERIEQALAEMAGSIEKSGSDKAIATEAIRSELRDLGARLDATEHRHEHRIAENFPADDVSTFGSHASVPVFDLPPFPDKLPAGRSMPPDAPETTSSILDLRASSHVSAADSHPEAVPQAGTAGADSFLAAARRTARAANSPQSREGQRSAAFSWVDPAGHRQTGDESNPRLVLLGGIGLLVVAAIAAGFYLSSTLSQRERGSQSIETSARNPMSVTKPSSGFGTSRLHDASRPARLKPASNSAPAAQSTAVQTKPLTAQGRLAALAGAGNPKAEEVLGLEYLDGDGIAVNEAEGAKWLERAAARGESVAAYRLGTLYERGHGVPVDQARATRWYAVAARAGNRKAMHNLAVAYAQGMGTRKDFALAAQWFLRAANLGLADSQFNLAVLYERGMGVPQSLTEAYKWYAIAAAQGDAESKARMEAIASQISASGKAAAENAAAIFRPATPDSAANSTPIPATLIGG